MKKVSGIILPNDWDQDGSLIEVVLYGSDESEFVISGPKETALLGLCHHRVECEGKQVLDNRGRWLLVVGQCRVLGDDVDSGYDFNWDGGSDVGQSFPRMWRQ
ncbi:hypothetical protein [Desulfovibrio ferrophilus]|uniref:Uncharacterized protein n=1 Tax=Desulfovibrio ferrophilus TaxID=241368 RepID=A0A2Z6AXV1_9BACT|nr:hypothetical protein [Desulfovibrio ferrophilus]BBD08092.1 uncharacterized protein DFE_1366 [Desulfovibrio ferrophilus]